MVYLCRLPTLDDRLVVIKMMKKTKLIRLNQVKNIIREKELVTRFECPYVVSAIGRFQVWHIVSLREYPTQHKERGPGGLTRKVETPLPSNHPECDRWCHHI